MVRLNCHVVDVVVHGFTFSDLTACWKLLMVGSMLFGINILVFSVS